MQEHGLTPRQINNEFTLGQLIVLFSSGYTWAEFGEMADANDAILAVARKLADAARQAKKNGPGRGTSEKH